MIKIDLKKMVVCSAIGAIYAAVSLAIGSFGFGVIQIRISEALTLLPVLAPEAIVGVTLGCFLANSIGVAIGVNTAGVIDIVVGTLATLVAALLTRMLKKIRWKNFPVLSALPPIIVNAIAIGMELSYVVTGGITAQGFFPFAASVAVGQTLSCFLLGLPLVRYLEKSGLDKKIFGSKNK